jgi:hypothetical protein
MRLYIYYMRHLTIILLLLTTVVIGQPSQGNGNGNGNGHNNPNPCNPHNPNCQTNVPISGEWILIVGGMAYGVYRTIRQRNLFKNSSLRTR